jgi:hypothetical protein
VNRDFRDLLAEFNAHGVEYLAVGAHAFEAHAGTVQDDGDVSLKASSPKPFPPI